MTANNADEFRVSTEIPVDSNEVPPATFPNSSVPATVPNSVSATVPNSTINEDQFATSANAYPLYNDYRIFQHFQQPLSTAPHLSVVETPYSSWSAENGALLTEQEILAIFEALGNAFKFQKDNVSNMFEYFMAMINSRLSRMDCQTALRLLHEDYIGGEHANYKKWLCAVDSTDNWDHTWKIKMAMLLESDYVCHIALYLLIWGEANNVRFVPEFLCYIFRCALESDEIQSVNWTCLTKPNDSNPEDFSNPEVFPNQPSNTFLDTVISPLYEYIRDQQYDFINGEYICKSHDHHKIVGYDDINQHFWSQQGLEKIKLHDGTKLESFPPSQRYAQLKNVKWKFSKSYHESRTWAHTFGNFSRVWIIHITMFWYYTCFNSPTLYTPGYSQADDTKPQVHVQLSAVSLGGSIACLIAFGGVLCEARFVRKNKLMATRACLLAILFCINSIPSVYIFLFLPLDTTSRLGTMIAALQFVGSVFIFLYLAVVPPARLFGCKNVHPPEFTANFAQLPRQGQIFSYILWVCVFLFKFIESYFFLTLSMRDPTRVLSIMTMRCVGDVYMGDIVCKHQAKVILFLLMSTNLVLFFLDTYLWYIICNCVFLVALSFLKGISIFTPWKNVFARLPDRIASKVVFVNENEDIIAKVAKIWNSVVMLMYWEHLLSMDEVGMLVYKKEKERISPPAFFLAQEDSSYSASKLPWEPQRRVSFFAQLLVAPLPNPVPVLGLPAFTVLVPHYSEKIILGLRETIRAGEGHLKVLLLEYLKNLYPTDWEVFVQDSKIWLQKDSSSDQFGKTKTEHMFEDIPYSYLGFKCGAPESTLRTRLWASLRSQTLYRTVLGFMNYIPALELLGETEPTEKFTLLVAMQRYQKFTKEERENAELLFHAYPSMKCCILEEEEVNDQRVYYSTLLNCSDMSVRFKIRLSGNPILGDGKSDNQNHALIFTRGEYIQVIDANQDNYLEECLKIMSVLGEFEDSLEREDYYGVAQTNSGKDELFKASKSFSQPTNSDDTKNKQDGHDDIINKNYDSKKKKVTHIPQHSPVAIVGTREHIFLHNTGILGDLAAGKEQTFGTLFARTLAEIGGKLHYGHPDFVNAIWMCTRGGISKAQRSLHLNEDIYAGMMVLCRGGRIKHCDYYQCGKGRDLGFGTILNFTKKIGAGMGEQMLLREYWWLGTNLPIDRFLLFYYAHAGFHLNNVFIMLSIEMFMLDLVSIGLIVSESLVCEYKSGTPITDPEQPTGCHNLQPVLMWIPRFVLSVFICFFISFVPLVVQELVEWGYTLALLRITRHFILMAPLFEVFLCQIYAGAVRDNLVYGGAQYIATGRGLATSREAFSALYGKYVDILIYSGLNIFFTICFSSMTIWKPALLWFWITIVLMCMAPFLFNPHQFDFSEFFMDYLDWILWMWGKQKKGSLLGWERYSKERRKIISGVKSEKGARKRKLKSDQMSVKPSFKPKIFAAIICNLVPFLFTLLAYLFINSQNDVEFPVEVNLLLRLLFVGLFPYICNLVILVSVGCLTIVTFGFLPHLMAMIAYFFSLLMNIVAIEAFFVLEGWNYTRTVCGIICLLQFHQLLRTFVYLFSSRELGDDFVQQIWWNGRWWKGNLGWRVMTQPFREFLVKIVELNHFAHDVALGNFLQFALAPIVFIPFIDKWHSRMLFWRGGSGLQGRIYLKRQKNHRSWRIFRSILVFFAAFVVSASLVAAPIMGRIFVGEVSIGMGIVQPSVSIRSGE